MAFVTLLYGDYENNSFINGVTIVALGLRKQNVNHDIICLITQDCLKYQSYLLTLFDKVLLVPYITGHTDKKKGKVIQIDERVTFDNIKSDIFTKLNIFNKDLLPYDKVVYVDADLIPIRKFDRLFDYKCPSGWLEINEEKSVIWSQWNFGFNKLIPKPYTDQMNSLGNSINGGLLVVKPDNKVFNEMIDTLQDYEKYCKKHKGTYSKYGFSDKKYFNYDQQFITQEFSGKWHYIDGRYNFWGTNGFDIKGAHMAGLRYIIKDKIIFIKSWEYQISKKTTYTYFTNKTYLYGFKKYPQIKKYVLKDLKFVIDEEIYHHKDINEKQFFELTKEQQKILKILRPNKFDKLINYKIFVV